MKKNVLVFPCGSEIGLEIHRSLSYSIHFEIFGGSSLDDHGKYIYSNYIGNIPSVSEPNFIESINRIVAEKQIDFIIPAHDSVLLKLAQAKGSNKLSCELITSELKTCEITRSKKRTYEELKDIILTPRVILKSEVKSSDFPIFLKPDVGQGSKGTFKASSTEDVEFYTLKDPTLLLLEYLPGKEYTIDCFTDRKGSLRFAEGRERKRIANGISVNSEVVYDKRFLSLADKINKVLSFRGAWFFQAKEQASNELVLMEVAPRIAGTMGLARCKGVNLVLLSLFDAMDYDIDIIANNYEIAIDRALENKYKINHNYSHAYMDLDDLIILNGKINLTAMAFIFQCINNGVKLSLLTRHKKNIEHTLNKYRLAGIFDNINLVRENDEKSSYIDGRDAIFIDDSYAERKKVFEHHSIPVFDAHMLEALLQ